MEIPRLKNQHDARTFAIKWQSWQAKQSLSYFEIILWEKVFYYVGKQFDLLNEFKENGIV